ncbi:MAG: serine hydrolase family protein [Candidatus Levybacteria bacterium]|nr:serine hydrolase family protein [Candidatus Levybacteria bacterium]
MMNKRIFIVHGWGGNPRENWFPWLRKELEAKGFEVFVPQLPDPENPRIYNWVPKLAEAVGTNQDEQTYFVGHSMGCQTIARYLENLPENIQVGGAVFVAGFFKRLTGLEDEPGVPETDKHWLGTPLDLAKVKSHLLKSVAIFSDNDPYVPLDNQGDFRDKLGSKIIIEHQMGHFNESAGIIQLPIALKSVLEISKK